MHYFLLKKKLISSFLGKYNNNSYWILNKVRLKNLIEAAGIKIIDTKIIYPKNKNFFSNRPKMILFGLVDN